MDSKLWEELHLRALTYKGTNDVYFLDNFTNKLAFTKCNCKDFWNRYSKLFPPTYANDEYFKWTVFMHNSVNHKLKKPMIQLEEARKYWEEILENKKIEPLGPK